MVVSRPAPLVGDAVPLVSDAVAVIGGPVALVSGMVTLVSDAVALIGSDLRLVERRPALGQVGLGGLEGLLGGLGPGLGLTDPEIVQGQGGQPLTLGVLDDLAGQLGQLAQDVRALTRSCWNAVSGSLPSVAARTPLACSIQIRLVRACCSWATSSSRLASSTVVWTSSPATAANSPIASSSWVVQARGWVVYTSRVPTGWPASRTGTLSTPRTRSWPTTASMRTQVGAAPRSWMPTARSWA